MKKLFLICLLALSSTALASGKLTIEGRANTDREVRPLVGLSVYQGLAKRLAWNSWSGYGVQDRPVSDDVHWLTLKNELQLDFGRGFKLSPGYTYQYNFTDGQSNPLYTLKLEKALW